MTQDVHEIERCLLSVLITQPGIIAIEDLEEDDFLVPEHRKIFRAILKTVYDPNPVRIASILGEEAPNKNWLPVVIGICESSYGPSSALSCFEAVKRQSRKRKFTTLLGKSLNRIKTGGDFEETLTDLVGNLMDLAGAAPENDAHQYDTRKMIRAAIDEIERDVFGDLTESRVPTGLDAIDDKIGGFHNSDLVVIGGRPAMGKTAMMVSCLMNAEVPVGVISTEMTGAQLGVRGISAQAEIPLYRLRRPGYLDDAETQRINAVTSRLLERGILINDRAVMHISDVILQAQRWKHEHDIKILFVDYLQRIKGGHPSAPKHERMEAVVQGLKRLAKEMEIPVVALAQVNREVENRPNKRPMMSDLKDSGAIEQEADLVLLLYRDEVYNPDTEDRGVAEIIVAKNRHGPVGTVKLAWDAEYTRFRDLDTMLEDDDFESQGAVG